MSGKATYRPLTAPGAPGFLFYAASQLLQLGVLRLGFFQDGNVGVGVFPEGEEILVGFSGFRRVACERGGARQAQVGKRVELSPIGVLPSAAPIGALVIQDLLELSRCLSAVTQTQV